jgi:pyridoxal phosphate enzyme (YggS family)
MAARRIEGREQDQGRARELRLPQLSKIVDPSGTAMRLVDNPDRLCHSEPPQLAQQVCPLAGLQVVEQDQHAATGRQLAHCGPQSFAQECISDEPPLRHGLAGIHGASYSARMSCAADRRLEILDGIATAAKLAGRDAAEVQLIAVSKGRSVEEIEALIEAGQRDFGENRVQEALAKWPALLAQHSDVRLHEIGRLQSNKAGEAVKLFDVIHSVDRKSLLDALSKEATKADRFPPVYVQVNIGEEEQKGGCSIDQVGDLIAAVRASPLPLAGLMAMPPLGVEPSPYFALLAKLARHHDVTGLSIGMSQDYKSAVMLGATAVRVGTALFED